MEWKIQTVTDTQTLGLALMPRSPTPEPSVQHLAANWGGTSATSQIECVIETEGGVRSNAISDEWTSSFGALTVARDRSLHMTTRMVRRM